MTVNQQLENIDPSVKDALFRRLMSEEDLGYLREEDNSIIGFELDLENSKPLSGYTIIAIQKHTILGYRSDLDEPNKLIIFPSMEKLTDTAFDLQSLTVYRCVYHSADFIGKKISHGTLGEVANDLIPPYKAVEVSDDMAQSMINTLRESTLNEPSRSAHQSKSSTVGQDDVPMDEPPIDAPFDSPMGEPPMDTPFDAPFDEPPMDVPFDDFNDSPFDSYEASPADAPDIEESSDSEKAAELKAQSFTQLSQVSDYVIIHMGVSPDFANNVINAALNATSESATQIEVAVLLFAKLFNENKL